MLWFLRPDVTIDQLGLIPSFITDSSRDDPITQINRNYQHGGGWRKFDGFKVVGTWPSVKLVYPGDPPIMPMAWAELMTWYIVFFEHAWVGVYDKIKDEYEIARID